MGSWHFFLFCACYSSTADVTTITVSFLVFFVLRYINTIRHHRVSITCVTVCVCGNITTTINITTCVTVICDMRIVHLSYDIDQIVCRSHGIQLYITVHLTAMHHHWFHRSCRTCLCQAIVVINKITIMMTRAYNTRVATTFTTKLPFVNNVKAIDSVSHSTFVVDSSDTVTIIHQV